MDEMLISHIDLFLLLFCFLFAIWWSCNLVLDIEDVVDGGFQFGSSQNQDRF